MFVPNPSNQSNSSEDTKILISEKNHVPGLPHNPSNSMETEEPSDTPLEVEPNLKLLLRTNRLAKISMFIWIGTTIGNILMYAVLLLFSLECNLTLKLQKKGWVLC